MVRHAVFLGDSFTAGQGDPSGLGYVGRVAQAAEARGDEWRVTNLGVGGATSEALALHWEVAVWARLLPGEQARLVVGIGANDTTPLLGGGSWVDHDTSVASFTAMLDRAGELGLPVFALGPGPAGRPEHDARSLRLEQAYGAACGARRVPFVPILEPLLTSEAWRREADAHDGLHPGASGYARLAELAIAGGLLDWLAAD
ncbi:MAG: GDSL-type esterase/lipase family protein [Patulibacter minatonensis]